MFLAVYAVAQGFTILRFKMGENKFLSPNSASVRVTRALTSGIKLRLLKKTARKAIGTRKSLANDPRMVSLKKTLQSLLLTTVVAKRKIPISSDCPDETVGFNREKFDEMVEKNKRNPYIEDLDISGVSETMP